MIFFVKNKLELDISHELKLLLQIFMIDGVYPSQLQEV